MNENQITPDLTAQPKLCAVFDFLLSRFAFYRKLIGGIWIKIHIVENPDYAGGFAECTWSGWVRDSFNTKKKYWRNIVESYGKSNYEKAASYKAFHYSFK